MINVGDKWRLEVIPTPGHTAGAICLKETHGSSILFSGDYVLPTITPNVSLLPNYPGGDSLSVYPSSLKRVENLEVSKVLPSHEFVFEGLKKRVSEIKTQHANRPNGALTILDESTNGMTGFEVTTKLKWHAGSWNKLAPSEKRSAMTETLAHLEYLRKIGKITEIQSTGGGSKGGRIMYATFRDCKV